MDDQSQLDLPPGVDADQLTQAVSVSGYPLQTVVALKLQSRFEVTEEWDFVDRTSGEHRSLDLFAHGRLDSNSEHLMPALNLLIECKRSELPYVFFQAAVPRIPPQFPSIVGFKTRRFEIHRGSDDYRDSTASQILDCSSLAFPSEPPIASTFCRAERKGKAFELSGAVPYNGIVLPLSSALEHHRDVWKDMQEQATYYPQISLCICVIDAPLVVASGLPESPKLRSESWVRLVRQEAVQEGRRWGTRQYVVDCVGRQRLGDYISNHALPFAEQVASRMVEKESMVRAAKGVVIDPDAWSWPDIDAKLT